MAEVAGLAVGILALTGIFKDCIDLFATFAIARSLGRDYELLNAKLEVERTLLVQWADRTKLLDSQPDTRLNEPRTRAAVARVISSIQLLMSDNNALQERYGLKDIESEQETKMISAVSQDRQLELVRRPGRQYCLWKDSERLDNRIQRHQRTPGILKARWAIRDKTKFNDLIQDLSYFVSRLSDLMPDVSNTISSSNEANLSSQETLEAPGLPSEGALENVNKVTTVTKQDAEKDCEKRIVRRMWFRLIDDRKDSLALPSPGTFEWVLNSYERDAVWEWDNFPEWLEAGSGIYWVCGKAGSGKSTLMKHVCGSERTKSLLERWAGGAQLITASFFFWYLGTEEQRSQEGLLRALLFSILDSDHSLISKLLPKMWQEAYDTDDNIALPSSSEMLQAFELMGSSDSNARKYCFFIDSLDEYPGKLATAIDFLACLERNDNMKIVISSRPTPACVEAFSEKPKMYLHDLIQGDIRTYTQQMIGSHRRMESLRRKHPAEVEGWVTEIVEKASGLFLWVVLACRSLSEGFANFDRSSDLQQRIDELPPELEDLFQHILSKIESRYQSEAVKYLLICQQSQRDHVKRLSTLGLAVADHHDFDLKRKLCPMSWRNAFKRKICLDLEGRLRSRCLGLVEIKLASPPSQAHDHDCQCKHWYQTHEPHDRLIDSTVEFLHRTVFDFLGTRTFLRLRDRMQSGKEAFDANAILACHSLHSASLSVGIAKHATYYIRDVVIHGTYVDRPASDAMIEILLQLYKLVTKYKSKGPEFFGAQDLDEYHMYDLRSCHLLFTMILAVEAGMINILMAYKSEKGFDLANSSLAYPLLYYAVNHPVLRCWTEWRPKNSAAIVGFLLAAGCDPNQSFSPKANGTSTRGRPSTPWLSLLDCLCETREPPLFDIAELFLEAGADADRGLKRLTFAPAGTLDSDFSCSLSCLKDLMKGKVRKMTPAGERHEGQEQTSTFHQSPLEPSRAAGTAIKRARSLSPSHALGPEKRVRL